MNSKQGDISSVLAVREG